MGLFVAVYFFIVAARANSVNDGHTCGGHGVPYRIAVSENGSVELSCAFRTCINFDGYEMPSGLRGYTPTDSPVKCSPFNDSPCSGDLEWTAGLMEVGNDSQNTVKFACCSYGGMKKSHLIRTMLLGENDRYEGGLVQIPNQTASFDLIKEVRKSVGSHNKINYVVTIHRLQCDHEPMDKSDDAAMPKRNKRRLSSEKKLAESDDDWNEGNDRYRRAYHGAIQGPAAHRRPAFRRRPLPRTYEDDYYDYEYELYVPRQFLARKRAKNNRLWPFPRIHADGGLYEPNEAISFKNEPDLSVVDSGSKILELSQVPSAVQMNAVGEPVQLPNMYPPAQRLPQYPQPYPQAPVEAYPQAPNPQAGQYPTAPRVDQVPVQPAPQAQQYYSYQYPAGYGYPNPSLNTIFDQMQCFSGDMKVETPSGQKAIKDLEVGDMVMSIDESMITFLPVLMFLHKLDDEQAVFLNIYTDQGEPLKLTENHLIYLTDCRSDEPLRLVPAKQARAGQCMQFMSRNSDLSPRRITHVSEVLETGIYAPLTTSGDIIVNRYLVSCHSNLALKALQQTLFSVYRSVSQWIRDLLPKDIQDDAHLPAGIHFLASVADIFVPVSLL